MKKLLVYAMAAIAALNAGCSKDPLDALIYTETGGTYRLTTLSATLEGDGADATRTSLQTSNNNVV